MSQKWPFRVQRPCHGERAHAQSPSALRHYDAGKLDKNSGPVGSSPRDGTHYGLIAKQLKAALDAAGATDFGGYIKTNPEQPDRDEALRYDQFIAPLSVRFRS